MVTTKSQLIIDIKPWDSETNLEQLTKILKQKELEGITWGEFETQPLAFGVNKLVVAVVIEDDKVTCDDIEELITEEEDYVQSIDIVAWNHIGTKNKKEDDAMKAVHSISNLEGNIKYAAYGVRGMRNTMEDEIITELDMIKNEENRISCFGIFDGHGGSSCAEFVAQNWLHYCRQDGFSLSQDYLEDLFLKIDEDFGKIQRQKYSEMTIENTIGSTATVLFIDSLHCCNSGDSRCILWNGTSIDVLSRDHKPDVPDERDRIGACDGVVEFKRVNGQLAVSRSFGDYMFKNHKGGVDKRQQMVTALPEIETRKLSINTNEQFAVLACDGLWDVMSNEQVVQFIQTRLSQQEKLDLTSIIKELVEYAVLERRSTDNVSVVIVLFA